MLFSFIIKISPFLLLYHGKTLFTQNYLQTLANAQNSFLHAVYLNDNTIYDLNYFITYSFEQLNKLYNFQVIKSLDYDIWQKAKQEYSYTKPESLLVSIGISDTTSDTQQMIEFLDSNNNFNSRKK